MTLFWVSVVMAVAGLVLGWNPVHQKHMTGEVPMPKLTLFVFFALIVILPMISGWLFIVSILLFLTLYSFRYELKNQASESQSLAANPIIHTLNFSDTEASELEDDDFVHSESISSIFSDFKIGDIVSFSYTNGKGETSERRILISELDDFYLTGVDLNIQEVRTFRVDRIEDGLITDEKTGRTFILDTDGL